MLRGPRKSTLFPSTPPSRSGHSHRPEQARLAALVEHGVGQLVDPGHEERRHGGHGRRSEEHTSELQSRQYLVCRLLLEKITTTYSSAIVVTFLILSLLPPAS